jgi:hypothetical protein
MNSPSMHGFINAKKRTNIAGQVAGQFTSTTVTIHVIACKYG